MCILFYRHIDVYADFAYIYTFSIDGIIQLSWFSLRSYLCFSELMNISRIIIVYNMFLAKMCFLRNAISFREVSLRTDHSLRGNVTPKTNTSQLSDRR